MRIVRMGLIGATLCAAVAGCKSRMHDENMALHEQNRELQAEKDRTAAELSGRPDASMLSAKDQELAAERAKVAALEAQLRQPVPAVVGAPAGDGGLADIETSFNQATGEMTVNLPGDVLFDAGRATLKDSSKSTLNKVAAAVKKDYAGKKIFVDGHTDSDPITKTKSMWKDNLDLSAARARAVVEYLTSQGIAAKTIGARGFGDTKPRSGDKSRSRRVEIVVSTR